MEAGSVASEDRERISAFFRRLHDLLERLIGEQPALFSPEVRELLDDAWRELDSEGRFEQVQRYLESEDADLDRGLAEHGLTRAQLRLKTVTTDRAFDAVEVAERKRFGRTRRLLSVVPWALKTADVALDSIAKVIPPAGAIKELKDATEAAIDERTALGGAVSRAGKGISRGVKTIFGRRPGSKDKPVSA